MVPSRPRVALPLMPGVPILNIEYIFPWFIDEY
jgi:hypothetical protein